MRAKEFIIESKQYKTGLCDVFAIALHELTGLPLGGWAGIYYDDLFDEEAKEFCHACVVLSFENTEWLDVDGYHKGAPDNCMFNNQVDRVELFPLNKTEVSELFTSCDLDSTQIQQAKQYILKHPSLQKYVNKQIQEDPSYGLPTLDKHRYSVLDKLVKSARQRREINSKAIQSLDEEIDDNKAAEIAKAVEWMCKKLNITQIPTIELSMDTDEAQGNHHTGGHVPGSGKIWVYAKNRNLVDLLRTVFHELVHVKQHELDMIKPDSSYPGSPIEAQADMIAGKMIKIFGAENPHIFE